MASARLAALDAQADPYASSRDELFSGVLSFTAASASELTLSVGKITLNPKKDSNSGDLPKKKNGIGSAGSSTAESSSLPDLTQLGSDLSTGSKRLTPSDDDDAPAVPEPVSESSGVEITLTLSTFPEYDSTVQIKIVQFSPHPTKPAKRRSRVALITGNRNSIRGDITAEGFQNKTATWAARYGMNDKEMLDLYKAAKSYEHHLWEIQIPFAANGMWSQNIYSANETNEDAFWPGLRATLASDGMFRVLVHAPGIAKTLARLNGDFAIMRQTNPLNAWFPEGKRKILQVGDIKNRRERPMVKLGAADVFVDFDYYITAVGFACVQEHECSTVATEPFVADLRVLELPGSKGTTYFAFISNLPDGFRLKEGDGFRLHPNDDREEIDDTVAWHGFVLNPLPIPGLTDTSAVIYRPQSEQMWDDTDLGQVTKVQTLNTFKEARNAVDKSTALRSTFRVSGSSTTFNRQINSLREITENKDHAWDLEREILLARYPSVLPAKDLYDSVADNSALPALLDKMMAQLNAGQQEAARICRHLPGGVGIIEGPPGTGKTFLVNQLVQPLMLLPPKEGLSRQPLLLLSASNQSTDMMAARLHEISCTTFARFRPLQPPPLIIRMFPVQTDRAIATAAATIARPDTQLPRFEEVLPDLSQMMAAKLLMDRYSEATTRPFPGVYDKRVKELSLTLGQRMLEMSGFKDSPWARKDNEEHSEFRRMFVEFQSGVSFEKEMDEQFTLAIAKLRIATLQRADAVVVTASTVGDFKLREAITPRVIVVDEAARISEADLWHGLAWFPGAVRIMVGDTHQIRPFVHLQNDFHRQAGVSLMRRLVCAGFRTVQLTEQHRYDPDICRVISTVWYEDALTTAPRANPRPADELFRAWSKTFCGIESQIVCLNTKDSVSCKDSSGSFFNLQHGQLGGGIIRGLLDKGFAPSQVGVLCAYQAQYNLYSRVITQIQQERPQQDLRAIRNAKIDGFQGDEMTIMIIDLTATQKIGFLKDGFRINTALSRGCSGVVLLLNHSRLSRDIKYRATDLYRVYCILRKNGQVTTMSEQAIQARSPPLEEVLVRAAASMKKLRI
ncbi:hypothetical protein MPH_02224 [Macrophomina phaseolina MS6]|uniref:Uncharacterized protein n=1 Tax=Macrophomina phaseolina (strain MS6) TaxID=1126212 RepID=K2RD90_MACPH|nr:hypothetical protein MPH_02224 [Macrophomina phaseolina MS6]